MHSTSNALVAGLNRLGCTAVWALGAAKIGGFLDAARRCPTIAVHGVPDEATAVMAADGAARATGAPAVAAFIGSVGLGIAAAGIQTVAGEGSPVLMVIGQSDPHPMAGELQDTTPTGSNDLAVLTAMGVRSWAIAETSELVTAWPAALATLAHGRPAALLLTEGLQWRAWTHGPLPVGTLGDHRPGFGGTVRIPASGQLRDPSRHPNHDVGMSRATLWQAIAAAAPGAHVFADAGQSRHVGLQLAQQGLPLVLHHCPRTACLGWGPRAALGAAAATGERTFAICGDGGLMMGPGVLAAAADLDLPVTVLLAANGILGVDAARGPVIPADLRIPDNDWLALGASMRVASFQAETASDVERLCRSSGTGPRLIVAHVPLFEDVAIDPDLVATALP